MHEAWQGNWKTRILNRLEGRGVNTLTEYLNQKPTLSYIEIANDLGKDDVAAFHVEWLHFEEAIKNDRFRDAAIDSLLRDIFHHLPNGWKRDAAGEFDTAGVWADWVVRLENYSNNIKPIALAVWGELLKSHPPAGWKPHGLEDRRIIHAFDVAWPPNISVETHAVSRPNA